MNLRKILLFLPLLLPFLLGAQNPNPKREMNLYEWAENKGQWDSSILFRTQQNALDIQLGNNFINYYFYNPEQIKSINRHGIHEPIDTIQKILDVYGLRMQFKNSLKPEPVLLDPNAHYLNFYQGNNPEHWATQVRVSNHIGLKNLYEGIQLMIHSANNQLKYEFHLEPGAQLSNIQIEILGASKLYTEYGDLYIETPITTLREHKAYAYQFIQGEQVQVGIDFKIQGNTISYVAGENYNTSYPLVIDPEIVFLTYSGSTVDNFGCTATPGENGTLYAAGISTGPYASIPNGKYPATANAFQLTYGGGGIAEGESLGQFECDITFSKYSTDGTTLLYATYLGGNNNEIPHTLFVDDSANLILMGNTYSKNFPVSANAYDTSQNGRHDIVVCKFKKDGTLTGSTYLGGSGNDGINFNGITRYFFADSYRGDIIADSTGEIYVASFTQSTNFPVSTGCIQSTLKGIQDGAIFKLSKDLKTLRWSTYLGGDEIDAFYSIDLDPSANILLSGGTNSPVLPQTGGSLYPTFLGGKADGVVMIIDNQGKNILRTSYFGTANYDQIISLERDKDGLIYIVGQSLGNISISPGVYSNPNSHQFLACLTPDLKTKKWSTVFGSGRNQIDLTINAFLVDDCKRIYVSSWGGQTATKTDFTPSSTNNMPVTNGAFQTTTDGSDFYLMLLNKNASDLLYATYIGGDSEFSSGDHVDGGTSRFDKKGVVYQSMCASCPDGSAPGPFSDLKTTTGVYAPLNLSPRCSNAALKFDFRINHAAFNWEADTCASMFKFKNRTLNAANFFWKFPDGDTSYEENPEKFLPSQFYGDSVMLIVEFGTNCADTAYGMVSLPDTLDQLKIPNVFTPNGDGKNDDFRIDGVSGQCDQTEVFIYNRWGQLYFEDKVSYFRWNGKDKSGIDAPEGVYFFMLRTEKLTTGKVNEVHGTITLIR